MHAPTTSRRSALLLAIVAPLSAACGRASTGEATTTSATVSTAAVASSMPLPEAATTPHARLELRGPALPTTDAHGMLETVATFEGQMPTGVAVSAEGRVFLSFPRWTDPIQFTVAELVDGLLEPYPSAGDDARLTSVQSVYVDARNHLWILDTGSVNFGAVKPGAARLLEIDLATNRPLRTIELPADVVTPRSYMNDVRVDTERGKDGVAFLSDSSTAGPNGIVVVDLATKRCWRRLDDQPSVKAEPSFLASVEGAPLYRDAIPGGARQPFGAGVDGITLSGDKKRLYYSPLASRHLYSVATDVLADPKARDVDVAMTVEDHGEKGASDGLEVDDRGRLYATNYENNAIVRMDKDGFFETVVSDPRLLWPDSLAVAAGGYLYVTANQLHRQAFLHGGVDQRKKPYALFRVKIDGDKAR